MRKIIAVPSMNPGGLESPTSGHFGHCDVFTLVHVEDDKVCDVSVVENLPHMQGGCQAPVELLHRNQANALIVGGIGMRPLMGFRQVGIEVFYGPEGATVKSLIDQWLEGRLSPMGDRQVCGGGRW